MSKKIFICNYDGCYRYGGRSMPLESDIEAVRQFRKNGGVFGLITERDVFEVTAINIVFQGEYDFFVASSGACGAVNPRLISDDAKSSLPMWIYRMGLNPSLVYDIVEVLKSGGAFMAVIDTLGFKGGENMAHDLKKAYEREGGFNCRTHSWSGGALFQESLCQEAVRYMFPISKVTARIENPLRTDGIIAAIKQRFAGQVAIHRNGSCFDMTVPDVSKEYGVRRMLDYLGMADGEIWAMGDSARDVGTMARYRGIAMAGSSPEVRAVAEFEASCVAEAIEIISK